MADVALIDPKIAYQQHQDNDWRENAKSLGICFTDEIPEKATAIPYLVKGVLAQKSSAMIYAQWSAGKTALCLDMCFHILEGRPWNGWKTTKATVLYCLLEGVSGFQNRIRAIRKQKGFENTVLPYCTAPLILTNKEDVDLLVAKAKSLPNDLPRLVVVDTLLGAIPGLDDKANSTMSAVITACNRLREEAGAASLLLHHTTKASDSNIATGGQALMAGLDTSIYLERSGKTASASLKKSRDSETGHLCTYAIRETIIGQDEEGEPIKAPTVRFTKPEKKITNGNAELVFDCAIQIANSQNQGNLKKPITIEAVRHLHRTSCEAGNERQNWKRGMDYLLQNQFLQQSGGNLIFLYA